MPRTLDLQLSGDHPTRVIWLDAPHAIASIHDALDIPSPLPVVVLVGGAGGMDEAQIDRLRPLFAEGLAPAVEEARGAIVDGGTNFGVMRLAGAARAATCSRFPLIGLAAAGTIELPESGHVPSRAKAAVDPHHTHLILVPGDHFGDEAPWIADVASTISGERPSVTLVVGGGQTTWKDVESSVAVGRPLIVVEGSGGTADALAHSLSSASKRSGGRPWPLPTRTRVVRLSDGPRALKGALRAALTPPAPHRGGAAPSKPAENRREDDEVRAVIDSLSLLPAQRRFLTARWLDQIRWMETRAVSCQRKYFWSRRLVILGSSLVPVLTTLALEGKDWFATGARWASVGVSLVVAIAAAWEEFFRNGERWRHHRRIVEHLKSEGWLFFERTGPYARHQSHTHAHAAFALRVEELLADDVRRFVSSVAVEKPPSRGDGGAEEPGELSEPVRDRASRRERPS